jgi:hypothetical protein
LGQGRDSDEPFFLYLSHRAAPAEFELVQRHAGRWSLGFWMRTKP